MKRSAIKPARRKRPPVDRIAAQHWHAHVTSRPCVMCQAFPPSRELFAARRPDFLRRTGHHLVPQQVLRRLHLEHLLWDPRNGLCLCAYHHGQHEVFAQRVPRELVPERAGEFAEEIDLGWLIERDYPAAVGVVT
jgi:hypothetical protein